MNDSKTNIEHINLIKKINKKDHKTVRRTAYRSENLKNYEESLLFLYIQKIVTY